MASSRFSNTDKGAFFIGQNFRIHGRKGGRQKNKKFLMGRQKIVVGKT